MTTDNGTPYNSAAWLVDRHIDDGRGDRIAIRCQGESTTYAELQQELWRAQNAASALGLTHGDRVAMVVRDDVSFPSWFLGAQRSGIVPVPLSTMLSGPELAPIIADSGARAVVVSEAFAATVPAIVVGAPAIEAVVVCGDAATVPGLDRAVAVSSWAEHTDRNEAPVAATTGDSPAFWLYSSGTTGTPKGVMHIHASMQATAETYAADVLGVNESDRFLSIAKLFFAFGLGNSLTFPFAVGATAILHPDPPTPAAMVDLIASEGATFFFASPGFVAATLDTSPDSAAFATLRATVTAGESLPAPLQTRFADLTGQPVLDGIGSTELLHIFLSNTLDRQVPGASGFPVAGYEAEIRDDDDNVIDAIDTPGYLHVKGPSAAVGYWERPDATAAAFKDGWVRTGDMYVRDAEGAWTFLGRDNDMIKTGGIWVSPAEVESTLIEHGTVLEAAVVGARDDAGLEATIAFVVPAAGATPDVDELQQHCRDRMAAFKRPSQIHVVDDLPKTATGKIKRFQLRDGLG
jgi:benzoate-CoA ligase